MVYWWVGALEYIFLPCIHMTQFHSYSNWALPVCPIPLLHAGWVTSCRLRPMCTADDMSGQDGCLDQVMRCLLRRSMLKLQGPTAWATGTKQIAERVQFGTRVFLLWLGLRDSRLEPHTKAPNDRQNGRYTWSHQMTERSDLVNQLTELRATWSRLSNVPAAGLSADALTARWL